MPEVEPYSFDTHAMIKDFIAAGFTEKQAETQVRALSNLVSYNLATKRDLEDVRKDLKVDLEDVRKDLKIEIEDVRKDLKIEIGDLRKETKTDIEKLRKETKTAIELLRRDLTIRLGGIMVTGIGVVLAVLALIITRLPTA